MTADVSTPIQGHTERCPHCGNVAGVERTKLLRYRCGVCGGPRVVVTEARFLRSGAESAPLARAQRARFRRATWAVTAATVGGFGLLGLVVALIVSVIAHPGVIASLALLLAVGVPLAVAVAAAARARESRRELDLELDLSWITVAREVLEQETEPVDARRLGELLGTSEFEANRLLARLNTSDVVQAQVTESGDLVYSTRSPLTGVRVEVPELETAREEAEEPYSERSRAPGSEEPS